MAIVPDESSTSASEVDFGANDWLLEEMYERYTTDPSSVDETWAKYFKSHGAPSTVTGDGAVQWLMTYRPDGTARFVGLQRVDGSLEGKSGSFVMETSGDFDGQVASWEAVVIPGSGTDDLRGLSGRGTFTAPHGSAASFELEYSLE